jgi:hypothetical protein
VDGSFLVALLAKLLSGALVIFLISTLLIGLMPGGWFKAPKASWLISTNPRPCSGLGAGSIGSRRPWNGSCYERFIYANQPPHGTEIRR